MSTINIEGLLAWSKPQEVNTSQGLRLLRKAAATEGFWVRWRADKEALKAAGISVGRDKATNAWTACWWQAAPTPVGRQDLIAPDQGLSAEQEARLAALVGKLLAYQAPSVRQQALALARYGGALDTSDTGTGKTFVTLATAAVLERPVFVCCPKSVIPSWRRAAIHFGTTLAGISNYELLRRGTTPAVKILDAGGKDERFDWQLPAGTLIVFDECHRLKDDKTLNCALGLAALRQGYKVLGLSATAADNTMQMKFVGLLTWLFQGERGFYPWMMKNGVQKGRWGLEFTGGRRALDKVHQEIFPKHGSRIRIADLGDAFPETQITAEAYELNGATDQINRIYEEMAQEIARIMASEAADKGACILVEQLRARQRAEVLKIPAIAEMVQDAVAEGMSVAVFVNFNDSADALMAKLKTTCCIRGGQDAAERENCIAAFQADLEPVIICNIKAGGVGVSLHGTPTSRRRLAIICPTFSGQDLKQALGRVWRANGAKSIQRIFFAAGTIEEDVCATVKDKIARIDTLNDGDLKLRGEVEAEKLSVRAEAERAATLEAPATVQAPKATTTTSAPPRPSQAKPAGPVLSEAVLSQALEGIKRLAGVCDKAHKLDDMGFSGADVEIGHSFARQNRLSQRQGHIAIKLCRKYKRQLGESFVAPLIAALEEGK